MSEQTIPAWIIERGLQAEFEAFCQTYSGATDEQLAQSFWSVVCNREGVE